MTRHFLTTRGALLAIALGVGLPRISAATATSLLEVYIITQHPQTGDYCFTTVPMVSSGIPYQAVTLGSFRDGMAWDTDQQVYVNVNKVVTDPPMEAYSTRFDDLSTTLELDVTVDVTALAAAHQAAGLPANATRDRAKLGLLAMARNLGMMTGQDYALDVTFVGLPSGPLGVDEWPLASTWTYTRTGPRLAGYYGELIDSYGGCR
jgi:hypothetical protein